MPARRANIRRADHAVTDHAVAAYCAGDWLELHRALGLKPWQINPLDVDPGAPPPDGSSPWADSFPKALQLRAELEAAVRAR